MLLPTDLTKGLTSGVGAWQGTVGAAVPPVTPVRSSGTPRLVRVLQCTDTVRHPVVGEGEDTLGSRHTSSVGGTRWRGTRAGALPLVQQTVRRVRIVYTSTLPIQLVASQSLDKLTLVVISGGFESRVSFHTKRHRRMVVGWQDTE